MRTFVMGDVHGAYKALVQCLVRSGFDKEKDLLITLGDICDGWPYVYECVEEFLTCKTINIIGNHDEWFHRWLETGIHPDGWRQGGRGTALSYLRQIGNEVFFQRKPWESGFTTALNPGDIPDPHRNFFMGQHLFYLHRNDLYVHAGLNREMSLEDNRSYAAWNFYWDRDLWKKARCCKGAVKLTTVEGFSTIYIGHTTCSAIDNMRPVYSGGVWNLDTGAGWEGKLTIMDVDTKHYWQSDIVTDLYPDETARR